VPVLNKYILRFEKILASKKIKLIVNEEEFVFSCQQKKVTYKIPLDLIVTQPQKLSAIIQSKLQLNKKVFARKCIVKKIAKAEACTFLDLYHMMNSTQSAFNYGLFLEEELLAVCSFSKGRKMNRLPEHLRSFELIRFCTKEGYTIVGVLTKIIKTFCREKGVGDIMTYVDKQFSAGESFAKAGFVLHDETQKHSFLINKKTFERTLIKKPTEKFNEKIYYLELSSGSLKFVYTPD
jgi:hypothetical protein